MTAKKCTMHAQSFFFPMKPISAFMTFLLQPPASLLKLPNDYDDADDDNDDVNPLNPYIKIQILICYPYTFSIEVVERIC